MRLHRILLPVALLAITAHASELPDLGDAARASVSLNQEERIGRQIMQQIRAEKDFLDDPVITDYLNALGDRLVAASTSPYRQIGFFVVEDPTINAFALPGGHIGVNTGLILAARNESELAGVLGHEIGHEVQNHIARSVLGEKTSMAAALAGLAVAILASHSDNPQIAAAAITSGQALAMQNQLSETQHYEKEADRLGLQTMANAGFDPRGMVQFFKHLMDQERLYDSNVPGFLQSHPMTYERMADLEGRVAQMKYKQHVDSPEFSLIRARIKAMTGEPRDAYRYFSVLAGKQDDAASYYGLALSALRVDDKAQAIKAVDHLEKLQRSSMVENLAAHVLIETGHVSEGIARLHSAIARYPDYKPLAYAYARALLRQGKAADARSFVNDRQQLWPDDYVLYQLLAECNHALGHHAEEHLAQAEAYIRLDQRPLAIEQLQLARQSGDGDFYTQSVVDAKLRDLRDQESREKGSQASK
jgi:predicted Zn-dependent protease